MKVGIFLKTHTDKSEDESGQVQKQDQELGEGKETDNGQKCAKTVLQGQGKGTGLLSHSQDKKLGKVAD